MKKHDYLEILRKGVEIWNEWRGENPGPPYPDLQMANLQGENLEGYDLRNTILVGANLKEAKLHRAKLQGAFLQHAKLQKAILTQAELQVGTAIENGKEVQRETRLRRAKLQGTDLRSTNLAGANVDGVEYDDEMKCRGINVNGCISGQQFIRHVMELDYLEEFKEKHPNCYQWWKISSNCGRSFFRWGFICFVFVIVFGAIYANYPALPFLANKQWIYDIAPRFDGAIMKGVTPYWASFSIFSLFGFVGVVPTNTPAMILVILEGGIGSFMIFYFCKIIKRKFIN